MTETEAQDAYYGALAHERELQLELAITDALISAATVYRDTVAKPGWANSVNYVTFAGTGLCMIAAAAGAPAGLIGGALYVAGVYTASYGVFGYSQYASQAISRSFPGLPGASHDATYGPDFERRIPFIPGLPRRDKKELVDLTGERINDKILEKLLHAAGGKSPIDLPSLPDEEAAQKILDYLERKRARDAQEYHDLKNQLHNNEPTSLSAPRLTSAPIHPSNSNGQGGRESRGRTDGNLYAGPDEVGFGGSTV